MYFKVVNHPLPSSSLAVWSLHVLVWKVIVVYVYSLLGNVFYRILSGEITVIKILNSEKKKDQNNKQTKKDQVNI